MRVAERGEEGDGRQGDCEDVFILDLYWGVVGLGAIGNGERLVVMSSVTRKGGGTAQRRPITTPIRRSSIQVSAAL